VKGRLRLGEVLLADGLISEFQLSAALGEQARWGNRLGETLVHLGFLTEQELVRALSRRYRVPGVDLEGKRIDPEVLARVPREMAESGGCLPLFVEREQGLDVLYVGMEDPSNLTLLDDVSFRSGLRVRPVVAGPLQLRRAIAGHYRGTRPGAPGSREEAPASRRGGLTEAVLPAEDTAPLLPGDARPVLEPPPEEKEPATPPVHEAGSAPGEAEREAQADARGEGVGRPGEAAGEAAGRPRQVPTRDILRALVRLLIEREVITREDLLRAVQELAAEGD